MNPLCGCRFSPLRVGLKCQLLQEVHLDYVSCISSLSPQHLPQGELFLFFFFFFSSTSLLLPTHLPPPSSCMQAQSCNPMDCSPTGSFVHGLFQARILEWVSISFFQSELSFFLSFFVSFF